MNANSNGNPERRTFAKGTVIFREGDRGAEAYLVQKGMVRIFKTVNGRRVVLGHCKPFQVFGELALLDDGQRMAAAEAGEDTTVMVLSKARIRDMLDSAAPGLTTLIQSLIGTMRSMGDELAAARAELAERKGG